MFFTNPRILKFEIDNSFSWFTSKTIKYKTNIFYPGNPFSIGTKILLNNYKNEILKGEKSRNKKIKKEEKIDLVNSSNIKNLLITKIDGENKVFNCDNVKNNLKKVKQMVKSKELNISSIFIEINRAENKEENLSYFYEHTKEFYEFYKKYFNGKNIKPNITHKYLKKLENLGKLKAIITQNIDGLHSMAGNKLVYELHGTTYSNHCIKCNKKYSSNEVFKSIGIPICTCGGIIKPDVVLYGEMLPTEALEKSIESVENADTLLVLGTSLKVYPAAGLINYFCGKNLVIINKDETDYDRVATLVIHDDLTEVFKKLDKFID